MVPVTWGGICIPWLKRFPSSRRLQCPCIVVGFNNLRVNQSNVVVQTFVPVAFAMANGESDDVLKAMDFRVKKAVEYLFEERVLFSGGCMDMAQGTHKAFTESNVGIFIFICYTHVLRAVLWYLLKHLSSDMSDSDIKDVEGRSIGNLTMDEGDGGGDEDGASEQERCDAALISAATAEVKDLNNVHWASLRSNKRKLVSHVLDGFRLAHYSRSKLQFQTLGGLLLRHWKQDLHLDESVLNHFKQWYFQGPFSHWYLNSGPGGHGMPGLMPSSNSIESFNKVRKMDIGAFIRTSFRNISLSLQ